MDSGGLEIVENIKKSFIKLWWETPSDFPEFDKQYNIGQQKSNGKNTDIFINQMIDLLEGLKKSGYDEISSSGAGSQARLLMWKAGKEIFEIDEKCLDIILGKDFFMTTSQFINNAKAFDDTMSMDDIMQAMRNVWIMNCIQVLLGLKVSFSPSIFAYSMLYPYTDNFLDSTDISKAEKEKSLINFEKKLSGQAGTPSNSYEVSLFMLVEMIETQYPRNGNEDIYKSLLSIHLAQKSSLAQQSSKASPYETDIMDITFEKGGTSVLADAFLVNGALSKEQIEFMIGFGILLQLADDLQDACTDMENGHMTMFSQIGGKWNLDKITNKLFNFTFKIFDSDICFTSEKTKDMIKLMRYSCTFLLIGAIANNNRLYSREYIKKIEQHSPLRFVYLKSLYSKLFKEYGKLRNNNEGKSVEAAIAAILAQ